MKLTKENAIAILSSRKAVLEPGKYSAKVTNVHFHDKSGNYILNLDLMTAYGREKAMTALKAGDFDAATNSNLTANVRPGKDYLPAKNETINVIVDYITNKQNEQALLVTGHSEMKASTAGKFDFSFEDEPATDPVLDQLPEVLIETESGAVVNEGTGEVVNA